jgi:cathepsin B
MQVERTFQTYKSGIFEAPKIAAYLGGHAVKALGWGYDETRAGKPYAESHYWIVANSWGKTWGEQGHFRIYMKEKIAYNAGYVKYDKGEQDLFSFNSE